MLLIIVTAQYLFWYFFLFSNCSWLVYLIEFYLIFYCHFCVFIYLEMPLPDRGNIFYAIKKDVGDVKFVVRKRTEYERYKLKHSRTKSRLSKFMLSVWWLVLLLAGVFLLFNPLFVFFQLILCSFIISYQVLSLLAGSVCDLVRS